MPKEKDIHIIYQPTGPHADFLSLYDLVLRPKKETSITRVKKAEEGIWKKLSNAQRKECDEETARISENKEKPEAKEPHEFKAAKYTHPNGHPRCLICGDEESTGKVCNMPDSWYDKHEWDDEEAWEEERRKLRGKKVIKSSEEYYEQLDNWDDAYKRDNDEVVKSLADGSVLDLGCGTGRLLKMLKDENRDVVGIDKSDVALEYCRKREVETKKLDLEKDSLPFDDESFDNVIAVHSLEHLEKPKDVLKEMARIARSKVIILSPLGERCDPSHKHKFDKLEDFIKLFDEGWEFREIEGNNTAIATLDKAKLEKVAVKPMGRFVGPKPAMAGTTELMEIDQIWGWAEKRLPLAVEEKLNSFRCFLEKLGDKARIKTEGDKDRTKQFADMAEKLKKIPDDFILDCGVGIDRKGKPLPRIDLMTLMADVPELEEGDVIKATIFDIPYWATDLHELPLKERREKLESFYSKYLKGDPHFALTNFNVVKDRKGLEAKFKELSKLPQSEGILLKTLDGIWEPNGSTNEWAKLKRQAEIKVIVLARNTTKIPGTYNYKAGVLLGDADYTNTVEFKGETYVDFGNTFNTKIKADPGSIITVGIGEIIPDEEKKRLQWLSPVVIDLDQARKKPYFARQILEIAERYRILQKSKHRRGQCMQCSEPPVYDVLWAEGKGHAWFCKEHFKQWARGEGDEFRDVNSVKEIKDGEASKRFADNPNPNIKDKLMEELQKAEEGGIDYKVGDKGRGILQLHIMGIEEDKINALKKVSRGAVAARHRPLKLKLLLKGAIGEQGAHVDLRLVRKGDDYFSGGEIFIGNLKGLTKLDDLEKGRKLRFAFKIPRVEEPTAETIRGPVSWMTVGKNKIEVIPPGEAGATAHKFGALLILDSFDWELYLADKHALKLHVVGGKLFKGNYLIAFVPITPAGKKGERIWMISKLKDDDHEKEEEEKKGLLLKFIKVDKKEFVVGGIVTACEEVDTQGDIISKKEIWEAMKGWMLKGGKIKVMHEGLPLNIPVIECYQADSPTFKGGTDAEHTIQAGDWYVSVYLGKTKKTKEIFKAIAEGRLNAFSIGGSADARKV